MTLKIERILSISPQTQFLIMATTGFQRSEYYGGKLGIRNFKTYLENMLTHLKFATLIAWISVLYFFLVKLPELALSNVDIRCIPTFLLSSFSDLLAANESCPIICLYVKCLQNGMFFPIVVII